jgi:PAS domain S-box-containing protein
MYRKCFSYGLSSVSFEKIREILAEEHQIDLQESASEKAGSNSILFCGYPATRPNAAVCIAICASHEEGMAALQEGAIDYMISGKIDKHGVSKSLLLAHRFGQCKDEVEEIKSDLLLAERQYQTLSEITSAGLWQHDLESDELKWSESLYRMLGMTEGSGSAPCEITDLAHTADRERVKTLMRDRLDAGHPCEVEFRMLRNDDKYIWVRSETYGLKNGKGEIVMMLGAIKNIDKRKRAELDLEIRKSQIENIADGINGILARHIAYPDGRFENTYVSSGIKSLYDTDLQGGTVSPESIMAKLEPSELKKISEAFQKSARENCKVDLIYYFKGKDGERKWLRVVAIPNKLENGAIEWDSITTDVTALKKRERAAREQKEMLHNIIDNLDGVVSRHRIHPDGRDELVFLSKGYEKISGTSTEEVMANPKIYWDQIYEEDRKKVITSISDSLKELTPWQQTWRIINSRGEQKWIQGSGTPSKQEDGTIVFDTVITDITTLEEITSELATAKQEFRLAAKSGQLGLWKLDLTTDELEWDEQMFKIFGVDPKDFSGRRDEWVKALHPEDKSKSLNALADSITTGSDLEFQFRIKRKDTGEVRHIRASASAVLDSRGEAKVLMGLNWDVTHIIRAQEKITESNSRYALASKASQDAIWDLDLRNNQLKWSPSFESLFGHSIDTDHDQFEDWAKCVHPEDYDRVVVGLENFIAGNQNKWEENYRFKRGNGSYAHVIDRGYVVRDYAGKAMRMVGTMRDITSTTEFLNAIKEQNEKLKKIAWTQSHELRGPLTRVMGLISLVDQDGFRDITLKEFLSYLTSATNELDQVIKDIVEASADIDVYQPDVNDEHSQFME